MRPLAGTCIPSPRLRGEGGPFPLRSRTSDLTAHGFSPHAACGAVGERSAPSRWSLSPRHCRSEPRRRRLEVGHFACSKSRRSAASAPLEPSSAGLPARSAARLSAGPVREWSLRRSAGVESFLSPSASLTDRRARYSRLARRIRNGCASLPEAPREIATVFDRRQSENRGLAKTYSPRSGAFAAHAQAIKDLGIGALRCKKPAPRRPARCSATRAFNGRR